MMRRLAVLSAFAMLAGFQASADVFAGGVQRILELPRSELSKKDRIACLAQELPVTAQRLVRGQGDAAFLEFKVTNNTSWTVNFLRFSQSVKVDGVDWAGSYPSFHLEEGVLPGQSHLFRVDLHGGVPSEAQSAIDIEVQLRDVESTAGHDAARMVSRIPIWQLPYKICEVV